jgi:hypothetical protein
MFELKEEQYPDQKVSIAEFTLLVNGIFDFKYFHKYKKLEIDFSYSFLKNQLNETYGFLLKTEVMDGKRVYPSLEPKNPSSSEERKEKLNNLNNSRKQSICHELVSRLEELSKEEKENILTMLDFLNGYEKRNDGSFPATGFGVKSHIDNKVHAYEVGSLMMWLGSNFNLNSKHGLPLAEWVRNLLSPPETLQQGNDSTYDGYIKIDTLPKSMQFMIECYDDKSLQRTTLENRNKKKDVYITDMHSKLNPLAIKQGITYMDKNKSNKGLSRAAVEQMMLCILEDKNN